MTLRERLSGWLTCDLRYPLKCAALILFILALIGAELYHILKPDNTAPVMLTCPDPTQGCALTVNGQPAQLRFIGTPSGLRPFVLQLSAPAIKDSYASFTMRGMDMGFNRYRLLAVAPGVWQARIVLPVCVTGRRDWVLTLSIGGDNYEIPFAA
ncbi:hypothetical protein [Sulfuriferula sp.]|uniref:hypothetical protein n=1 Tax=Sulfuriferula sp. TaxID=2025307 RepID=UPI0027314E1B|nr:hypothetical protein [Sulfuriferula sp.]MDP2024779.1 hypothetical protein [Sulfuriferula sp.]